MTNAPSTSVLVAIYNHPDALELCLSGLAAQTDQAFDVVVADDGSDPPAAGVVERLRSELPFAVRVVAQEDDGFRKARAMNLASLQTPAQLLVFLDGDCVPFRDLVAVHRACWRPGEFCVGGASFLSAEHTRALTAEGVRAGAHEVIDWRERLHLRTLHWKNLVSGYRRNRPRIRGANFSVSADLFERVDGFDEVFCGYGKEDSDIRNRMRNAGARGISAFDRAHVMHLARDAAPVGVNRQKAPRDLYEQGFDHVRARLGRSQHGTVGAERADFSQGRAPS